LASSGPSQSSLGWIETLYQNDLTANLTDGAILLPKPVQPKSAAGVCSSIGEALLSAAGQGASGNRLAQDIQSQIDYLKAAGRVSSDSVFWVQGSSDASPNVYSVSSGQIMQGNSSGAPSSAGVLCSHMAPLASAPQDPNVLIDNSVFGKSRQLVLQTTGGYTLLGTRDRRSFRFLGIPFADAPLKAKRFQHSTAYTGSKQIDATDYRPACHQAGLPASVPMSEDCLNLNVFTTSVKGTSSDGKLKPVVVFFYGGSYVSGRNSEHAYDGGNFASRSDIVVVTANYRLGALGYLAYKDSLPGNAGTSDQIQALQWVRQNIEAFGGDPDQVTIMGQSAGAQSVMAVLSSSSSVGLYRAAVMLSNPWIPMFSRKVYDDSITPATAVAVGCQSSLTNDAELVSCLQSADPNQFFESDQIGQAQSAIATALSKRINGTVIGASFEPYNPVPENIIDDQYFYLVGNGTLPNKVPLLVGTTSGEGNLFIPAIFSQEVPASLLTLELALSLLYLPDDLQKIAQSNVFPIDSNDSDIVRKIVTEAFTLNYFTCPTESLISLATTKGLTSGKTYLYEMRNGHSTSPDPTPECAGEASGLNVCHASDLVEVFGTLNIEGFSVSDRFLNYTRYVQDSWSAFIRNLDPNPSSSYLQVRGRSYEHTLELSQSVPWKPFSPPSSFSDTSSDSTTQIVALQPSRERLVNQTQCAFYYENNLLTYQRIDNTL
ncbi:alpha/beta-hydrolase, partial [Violaceomyces palustris]